MRAVFLAALRSYSAASVVDFRDSSGRLKSPRTRPHPRLRGVPLGPARLPQGRQFRRRVERVAGRERQGVVAGREVSNPYEISNAHICRVGYSRSASNRLFSAFHSTLYRPKRTWLGRLLVLRHPCHAAHVCVGSWDLLRVALECVGEFKLRLSQPLLD